MLSYNKSVKQTFLTLKTSTLHQSNFKNKIMENTFLFIPSGMELVVVVFVILLLFGGKKIPELMRGMGKGIREFNSAKATIESEIKEGMKADDVKGKEKNMGIERNA
jgi:sec-independent protein translocase protein TatA